MPRSHPMPGSFDRPTALTYLGLAAVTLSTLLYELLLTRLFSVVTWYHFAFMAISVAMFGATAGALGVFLAPQRFRPERAKRQMALAALGLAVSLVWSLLTFIATPFDPDGSFLGAYTMGYIYLVVSVPFFFSGVCVCLALTRFRGATNKLYAADLAGAALGCLAFLHVLDYTDGPTAVLAVAALAAAGAALFAWEAPEWRPTWTDTDEHGRTRTDTDDGGESHLPGGGTPAPRPRRTAVFGLRWVAVAVAAGLGAGALYHDRLGNRGVAPIHLRFVKGSFEKAPLYQEWNAFSRVAIHGVPDERVKPIGWGMSRNMPAEWRTRQLLLTIDGGAGSRLTHFNGDTSAVRFLKWDVVNTAHALRTDADVMVIGTGGGRDVLSALAFKQKSVTGVEINPSILHAVNGVFGDFTGHLDRLPNVRFFNDEARSWLTRTTERFDIIQVSLIDTWAASAAGAYVLTENTLYTVEAWKTLLARLKPGGIVTFSRWYRMNSPVETYRLVSLAAGALKAAGVSNPREHLLLLRSEPRELTPDSAISTILVSDKPFTAEDVSRFEHRAQQMSFVPLLTPGKAEDRVLADLASPAPAGETAQTHGLPVNLDPPTDDNPFFFNMIGVRQALRPALWRDAGLRFNFDAVRILVVLMGLTLVLAAVFVLTPMLVLRRAAETAYTTANTGDAEGARYRLRIRDTMPLLLFFASIGLGFMLVEISQVQRLTVFLGHPSYSLSVVLFTVLLSSGLGSWLASPSRLRPGGRGARFILVAIVAVVAVLGVATPLVASALAAGTNPMRIAGAVAVIAPLGLLMGMAFPLGISLAERRPDGLAITPWLWAVNGALSVCGSVAAVAISLFGGISTAYWCGLACYVLAALAYRAADRSRKETA